MECEQRASFEHEIALWKQLEGAAGNHSTEMGRGAAPKHVAAMRLAKTIELKFDLSDSQREANIDDNVTMR